MTLRDDFAVSKVIDSATGKTAEQRKKDMDARLNAHRTSEDRRPPAVAPAPGVVQSHPSEFNAEVNAFDVMKGAPTPQTVRCSSPNISAKTISDRVTELERAEDMLSQIRATLLVNFGPGKKHPLIEKPNEDTLRLLVTVLQVMVEDAMPLEKLVNSETQPGDVVLADRGVEKSEADAIMHRLWTKSVGQTGYDKSEWLLLEKAIWSLIKGCKVASEILAEEEEQHRLADVECGVLREQSKQLLDMRDEARTWATACDPKAIVDWFSRGINQNADDLRKFLVGRAGAIKANRSGVVFGEAIAPKAVLTNPKRRGVAIMVQSPDKRYLLCERTACRDMNGFWQFPGGAIEDNESAMDAAIREIREEVGWTILPEDLKRCSEGTAETPEGEAYWTTFFLYVVSHEYTAINTEPERHGPWRWLAASEILKLKVMPLIPLVLGSIK